MLRINEWVNKWLFNGFIIARYFDYLEYIMQEYQHYKGSRKKSNQTIQHKNYEYQ